MAGIGFELKRLFSQKSITAKFAGVLYSVFSTVGHMLFIAVMLIAVNTLLSGTSMDGNQKALYSCAILYSFLFPLVFSSGLNNILSRYIADALYTHQTEKVLPSLFGGLAVYCLIAAPPGILFILFSSLDLLFNLIAFCLYMEMGLILVSSVYVSSLKNYKQVSLSFLLGVLVAFGLSYYSIFYVKSAPVNQVILLLLALICGMAFTLAGLLIGIKNHFSVRSDYYFDFLNYFRQYPFLFLSNLFYSLGLYVHNFVFWLAPATGNRIGNFYFSSEYDMCTFLGVVSILPATVFFVVSTETRFSDCYETYIAAVNTSTGDVIHRAKQTMRKDLYREYFRIMELQSVVSLLFIVLGMGSMAQLGLSAKIIEMYPFLACGFFFAFMMFITVTLMLYYENHTSAFRCCFLFFSSNLIFTVLSVLMGEDFYGIGMAISGAISFLASYDKLKKTIEQVDYIMFCSQSLRQQKKTTRFQRLVALLDGKR